MNRKSPTGSQGSVGFLHLGAMTNGNKDLISFGILIDDAGSLARVERSRGGNGASNTFPHTDTHTRTYFLALASTVIRLPLFVYVVFRFAMVFFFPGFHLWSPGKKMIKESRRYTHITASKAG